MDYITYNLILEIEKRFQIKKINNKDIANLNSFKKILQYLKIIKINLTKFKINY